MQRDIIAKTPIRSHQLATSLQKHISPLTVLPRLLSWGKFLSVCGKLLNLDPDLSQFCRGSTQSDKRSFFKRDRAGRFLSANKLNIYTRDLHANETNGASHPRNETLRRNGKRRCQDGVKKKTKVLYIYIYI